MKKHTKKALFALLATILAACLISLIGCDVGSKEFSGGGTSSQSEEAVISSQSGGQSISAEESSSQSGEPEDDGYVAPTLKVAVFADVQLETENRGNTRNAYLTLKNHFRYCKSTGVDVIFMPGDIMNKADSSCYEAYEKALRSVYGSDESEYPELILCMGNHEWWDSTEKDVSYAVSNFNAHARIDTDNLVKRSAVKYVHNENDTLPTYYKVVNGVPFLVVSGIGSTGEISAALKAEIKGWLEEIAQLPSVKHGGPIYVAYHYPIPEVTYKGESTYPVYAGIDDLLKNYPSAIVFTGDTHFNGVNERTINQRDYTAINIGSSSYSRNVSNSATGYEFKNVNQGASKNVLNGEVSFKFEYTPTIHIADMYESGLTTIERFFTADSLDDVKKVGLTWEFKNVKSKSDFVYTNDRIQNTEWANRLYGADGLSWGEGEEVRFNVENDRMMVVFNDVTDYNCAEHYRIAVQKKDSNRIKYYDYSGNYYKYDSFSHTYHFIIDSLPAADAYVVKVTAYDFFDNPSLNVLTSSEEDETLAFADEADLKAADTYSDASRRVNYEVTAEGSCSSFELYYRGISTYQYGMAAFQILYKNNKSMEECLSVTDWSDATITMKVKNPNPYSIKIGLSIITLDGNGNQKWIDDFGASHLREIEANSDWVLVEWNLKNEYGITSNSFQRLGVKASANQSFVDVENGYDMTVYFDDMDIINTPAGEVDIHLGAAEFSSSTHLYYWMPDSVSTNSTIMIDFKFDDMTSGNALCFRIQNQWGEGDIFFGAYHVKVDGTKELGVYLVGNSWYSDDAAATLSALEDGWYRLTIDLSRAGQGSASTYGGTPADTVNCIFILNSNGWAKGSGKIKYMGKV